MVQAVEILSGEVGNMVAVMGITGNVGGSVARHLLSAGLPVRGVVRDPGKAAEWAEKGCELQRADIRDARSLESAFNDAEGVFILVPPVFDPRAWIC